MARFQYCVWLRQVGEEEGEEEEEEEFEDDDKQNEKEDRGAGHWRRWTKSRSGIGRE